jgi:hypothetical protein
MVLFATGIDLDDVKNVYSNLFGCNLGSQILFDGRDDIWGVFDHAAKLEKNP